MKKIEAAPIPVEDALQTTRKDARTRLKCEGPDDPLFIKLVEAIMGLEKADADLKSRRY